MNGGMFTFVIECTCLWFGLNNENHAKFMYFQFIYISYIDIMH